MVKQIPDISMLYALKRSDLFAYAPSTHSLINDYEKQENFRTTFYNDAGIWGFALADKCGRNVDNDRFQCICNNRF